MLQYMWLKDDNKRDDEWLCNIVGKAVVRAMNFKEEYNDIE